MFNKNIFILAHQVGNTKFYPTYKMLLQSQWYPYFKQKESQEKKLRHIVNFAYNNVPYYHNLFDSLKLDPSNIKKIEDLEKLPILTKDIIRNNWEDFIPLNLDNMKYYNFSTGGSTGTPFKYRLSKYDRFLSAAMLYRGWGYAGYELGDSMVILAGSSLDIGSKSLFFKKSHEVARNIRKLSSFDMGSQDMLKYVNIINSFKPMFLRGYASSINFLSNFIREENCDIFSPRAVFTTAEKLMPNMRKNIENIFGCDVYDAYGLNDGGVTANECPEHSGLHIDTERSIMEIVDDDGHQLEDGAGKIVATDLHNYSMPFIRYDTQDLGSLLHDTCGCGRKSKLLKEIIGRQQDILQTPEGKFIHGEFFTHIFWEIKGVLEFQIIQITLNKILIKVISDDDFDENEIDKIQNIIRKRSEEWDVEVKLVDKIDRTKGGKYRFIINEVGK